MFLSTILEHRVSLAPDENVSRTISSYRTPRNRPIRGCLDLRLEKEKGIQRPLNRFGLELASKPHGVYFEGVSLKGR